MLLEYKRQLLYLTIVVFFSVMIGVTYFHNTDNTGYINGGHQQMRRANHLSPFNPQGDNMPGTLTLTLALVACGWRANEAVVSIKSAVMFTQGFIDVRIFVDEINLKQIPRLIKKNISRRLRKRFTYTLYNITLPEKHLPENWNNNLKKCCTQRLFFPELLPDVERLIYVDTDTLFFVPFEEVWREFDMFNSVQIAAIVWHNEDSTLMTYTNDTVIPFYKPYGINSGVILMDLNRIRSSNWSHAIDAYFDEYKDIMLFGDQDLMNIFFYHHSELLMKLGCKYNYRPVYCRFGNRQCLPAIKDGISILHGLLSVFRKPNPVFQGFKLIHEFFNLYNFTDSFGKQLKTTVKTLMKMTRKQDRCRHTFDSIVKRLRDVQHI